jgi:hypothetical protein
MVVNRMCVPSTPELCRLRRLEFLNGSVYISVVEIIKIDHNVVGGE